MTNSIVSYLAKVTVLAFVGVLFSLLFRWIAEQRPIDLRPSEI
jgi:hypothetical protein